MKNQKVINVTKEFIEFNGGFRLFSSHNQDCCENHWLSFDDLILSDFDNMEFDLTGESFFRKVDGFGIELIPIKGFSIKIPGYGSNNGYYSSELTLVLKGDGFKKEFDISECQNISE